jgi:hypothetical protein
MNVNDMAVIYEHGRPLTCRPERTVTGVRFLDYGSPMIPGWG